MKREVFAVSQGWMRGDNSDWRPAVVLHLSCGHVVAHATHRQTLAQYSPPYPLEVDCEICTEPGKDDAGLEARVKAIEDCLINGSEPFGVERDTGRLQF